jgi:hypothetical protein
MTAHSRVEVPQGTHFLQVIFIGIRWVVHDVEVVVINVEVVFLGDSFVVTHGPTSLTSQDLILEELFLINLLTEGGDRRVHTNRSLIELDLDRVETLRQFRTFTAKRVRKLTTSPRNYCFRGGADSPVCNVESRGTFDTNHTEVIVFDAVFSVSLITVLIVISQGEAVLTLMTLGFGNVVLAVVNRSFNFQTVDGLDNVI